MQQQQTVATSNDQGGQKFKRAESSIGGRAKPWLEVLHPSPGTPIDCGDFFVVIAVGQGQAPPRSAAFALVIDGQYQGTVGIASRRSFTLAQKPLRPGNHSLQVFQSNNGLDFDRSIADIGFWFASEWRGPPPSYGPTASPSTFVRAWNPAAPSLRILHGDEVLALPKQKGPFEIATSLDWLGIR